MKKFKCIKQFMDIHVGTIGEQIPSNFDIRFRYNDGYKDISSDEVEFLKEFFEEVKGEEIGFNKWIGRYGVALYIKGKKKLFSHIDGTIIYEDDYLSSDELRYQKTTMDKLEYGDVFCKIRSNYESDNFCIFMGKDIDNHYVYQYLFVYHGLEFISDSYIEEDIEVYKFLRS